MEKSKKSFPPASYPAEPIRVLQVDDDDVDAADAADAADAVGRRRRSFFLYQFLSSFSALYLHAFTPTHQHRGALTETATAGAT